MGLILITTYVECRRLREVPPIIKPSGRSLLALQVAVAHEHQQPLPHLRQVG